jgi:hypothetical protein
MRINVRITLDDSDLTLEEIAYILAGGDTPVATVADDIETVETVQEEIEIEEPEIVEETVEVVEETPEPEIVEEPEVEPEVEPEEEEQEEIQDEVVTEVPQTTTVRRPRGRRRTIPATRKPVQRRRDGHTPSYFPQRTSKTEEPQQPALEDIMGALTKVRVELLKENNITTVGEFLDADDDELLRVMQMNWKQETELGLAKRTARALITAFEKALIAYQKTQIEKAPPKPKQFDFSEKSIFYEVWNNIPSRKAGMYHSVFIALDTINRIEQRYENGADVKHQDVLDMTCKVLNAIYQQADSPEFVFGGTDSGMVYLVVLTNTKWPSRTEIEGVCLEHEP